MVSCASAFNISNTYRSRLCAAREGLVESRERQGEGGGETSGGSCLPGWFADSSSAAGATFLPSSGIIVAFISSLADGFDFII